MLYTYIIFYMKQFTPRIFCLLVCISIFSNGFSQSTGSISGVVVDKQSQQPLANVSVLLEGTTKGVTTDVSGKFRLTGIDLKTYNIVFTITGYKKQTLYNIVVNVGNENYFSVEMEPITENLKEVVVKINKRNARAATMETPLSVQRLTAEEIKSNPGGNFDISKVIQTLPGVGGGQQGGGFRNDIIIRGGAPNENVFYLDGIEIPVLNHFQTQGSSGGPQGMLNVSFIEDVKLSTSAFDARYDNALSSVFQFKQRTGNPNKLQGNVRLSATELAGTLEGPLSKSKKTTFLASARRSYLQLLFTALDLPIRPNFWDFQTKITHQINPKTSISFIGLGAIDDFRFATIKEATPEKLYILNSNPFISQWNYTAGFTLKRLMQNGFMNIAFSRNAFNNGINRYEDNVSKLPAQLTLDYTSRETENKLRLDVNKSFNGWKVSYGASAQLINYTNSTYNVYRKELTNAGTIIQPAVIFKYNTSFNMLKHGTFVQVGKRLLDNRLSVSAGIRTDNNNFTNDGNNLFKTLSPRLAMSYVLADRWTFNASVGRYFKIPPYTILGFKNNAGVSVNQASQYLKSDHYVAGLEYLPNDGLRLTTELFYKKYSNVPVSLRNGIALSNLGSDFNVLGNEAVSTTGKGKAYGLEMFAQKKLSKRFFGILSYTFYRSLYSGIDNKMVSSSWDNKHLLSVTWGYKFPHNWELGLKFRYQGGAPYTPYDDVASKANYLSQGEGVLDYTKLNTLRLNSFNSSDVRIDKKWNFKKTTLDLYMDVTNWYIAKNGGSPTYTFKRTTDNSAFATTNGQAIANNGSNAIPLLLLDNDASVTPTIGFIVEF